METKCVYLYQYKTRSGEAVQRVFQGILELNSTEGFALQTIQR